MCDPVSLAVASTVATVGGTVQQASAQRAAGKAASNQAAYQAAVARNNEIRAQYAAEDAIKRGKIAENRARSEAEVLKGRQRAVLAANGVTVGVGSAADILADTARIGEVDALTIRSNAEREAYEFRAQGDQFASQATLADAESQNALSASKVSFRSTLLSGIGTVAQKWYGYSQNGIFGKKSGGYTSADAYRAGYGGGI